LSSSEMVNQWLLWCHCGNMKAGRKDVKLPSIILYNYANEISKGVAKQLEAQGKTQEDLEHIINDEVQLVRKSRAAHKKI
jgi:hypothetical protein